MQLAALGFFFKKKFHDLPLGNRFLGLETNLVSYYV
jgi:hypothetical protein